MGKFSQLLAKYYKRERWKVVFKNDLSLNQLSLEMWERLGCSQIDPSVLSRVMKGKRLFSFRQLRVFCDLLDIPQFERNNLFKNLEEDYLNRRGELPKEAEHYTVPEFIINKQDVLDSLANALPGIKTSLIQSLYDKLIPREGEMSTIGLAYKKGSYYKLIKEGVSSRNTNNKLANYNVKIPVCGFQKTVSNYEDNCNCGYHLALYGVIERGIKRLRNRGKIQQIVDKWMNYFFPRQTILELLSKN